MSDIKCKTCGRHPGELTEYISASKVVGCTPEEYVTREEGTFNHKTGLFYCTSCYLKIGMPLGTA